MAERHRPTGLPDCLRTDDAPAWAEVLGMLIAGGALVRTGVHAWVALLGGDILDEDVDPHIAAHDMTLASPVVGLRGHRLDRVARFVTAVVGLGGWMLFDPVWIAPFNPAGAAWLGAQLAFLAADPVLWLGSIARQLTRDTRSTQRMRETTDTRGDA